ncbi:phosphotransferase [Sphingomonas sp. MAH-20]|uniref:Phosphotransferase n=1 Tax=Sphingomonas horti TaxID=2682842 RepID=A0A6I4J307_9SPHN|nr:MULTISPECIES: phosphotransferase [Sphingomonas]MBA2919588.1 phosphotransferase [Sphingomonas sp. CGMCC 1.13658]MVO78468.1 phosphotransferase [Sphingomonas horti]
MNPPAAAPEFLKRAGWHDAEILPLAGDASFRRYFRVEAPGRHAVLMDSPAPHEDPRPFLTVAEHLIAIGLSAPRTLAADLEQGLVLLEDFGDARMREVLDAAPEAELRIYSDAVDLLARLHKHRAADLPPYDEQEYLREAGLLTEWFAPAVGLDLDPGSYRVAWSEALAPLLHDRSVTVLRDYHAENIMLIEGREGIEGLGLLDFQDALAGHPAYDLVSLLQDARRDVPKALEADMLNRYLEATRPGEGFTDAYWLLGAQRNAKIVGIFTRLWKRDGKPRYLSYLPRVWGYLERDLAQPALAPVRAWFDANIPADKRGSATIA